MKSSRIALVLSASRSRVVDRYWFGLSRLIEVAENVPFTILPDHDSLLRPLHRNGYRTLSPAGDPDRFRTILREAPLLAALVDSGDARALLRKQGVALSSSRIFFVRTKPETTFRLPFIKRQRCVVSESTLATQDDLFLPFLPQGWLVSEERAAEFRTQYRLSADKRVVWIPRLPDSLIPQVFPILKSLLQNSPDCIAAIGILRNPLGLLNQFPDTERSRIITSLSESGWENAWSVADISWLFDTSREEMGETYAVAAAVGLPVLTIDDSIALQWVAAGFAEEAVSLNYPARWIERTTGYLSHHTWEERRERIQRHHERWGEAAMSSRLLRWITGETV